MTPIKDGRKMILRFGVTFLAFVFATAGVCSAQAVVRHANGTACSCAVPCSLNVNGGKELGVGDGSSGGGAVDPGTVQDDLDFSGDSLASAQDSVVANMVGDFFGGSAYYSGGFGSVPIAGGDRRFKPSENASPVPQTRLFFSYHNFQDALKGDGVPPFGQVVDLDRYVLGYEQAFWGGQASLEVRVPFADGLDSQQVTGSPTTGVEFGNISLTPKVALFCNGVSTISTGVGVVLPTADDGVLLDGGGGVIEEMENDAVHLIPFIGLYRHNPCSKWHMISYISADFDANGNTVNYPVAAGGNPTTGRYQDQTILHADLALQYDWYVNPCAAYVTRIRPLIELHYSTTLENSDVFLSNDIAGPLRPIFVNPFNRIDTLNLTLGTHIGLGSASQLTLAVVAPLRKDNFDRDDGVGRVIGDLPDVEFALQFNRRF